MKLDFKPIYAIKVTTQPSPEAMDLCETWLSGYIFTVLDSLFSY